MDGKAAERGSEARIWRSLFWVSVLLTLLFLAGLVVGLNASDGSGSVLFYIPQLGMLVLWPLILRFVYRKWRMLEAPEHDAKSR